MRTSDLDYHLPPEAIAQVPVEPRHSARLLDTTTGRDHLFAQLPDLLDPGDLVVVNDSRVRAARLRGRKTEGGGAVELLILERLPDGHWSALVRPARRLRTGSRIEIEDLTAELLTDPEDGIVRLRLGGSSGDIETSIAHHGEMPLPPYITANLDDPERYQTIFANVVGSAAAPTAGLHFTPQVVDGLSRRGIQLASLELRVGLGTFRPVATERLEDHRMHAEQVMIQPETADAVAATRRRGGRVVAIGTTVVRALESRADGSGGVRAGDDSTQLFITPGYEFTVVDRLVTNFHLPRSSLIAMVAAFMGEGWRDTYRTALERGFRFLSFGDAMLADRLER